jgi:hypothetical protein
LVRAFHDQAKRLELFIEQSSVDSKAPGSFRLIPAQLKIEASTVAQAGKPIVVGSVDDPNPKRQFQLEVTVTKLS